ncbi:MAG: hypothetical protein COX02_01760 [Candidatus Vogelbacteria bacterium CG22_combo_CG10-13_8_21_14_all_37_9]|uniref:Exostosin GT47 domain-containing protein n=1 Tax=Candidatus Vogelbacteria bacterium CG22_combo_CG10-13_8_21_14_all_37_9 TaxID=1975046 RepID=A0A2H0BMA1_9BACT|nr:MAG: hypothetical protein BK005_02100 [bacterium CG10_37_50]PIP58150.1 MAG: hypothetical protein COX02_01760 [Candidatus Vogelbacteria bacterium CG22_combo_CG10-13_8_21_14_all_37_9]
MNNSKLKVYHGPLNKTWPLVWFLLVNYPDRKINYGRFGEVVQDYFEELLVEIVDQPDQADYLLLPYLYNQAKVDEAYLLEFSNLAKQYKKQIIVVYPGDSNEAVELPSSIVFRNSQYRQTLRPNEIMMPALTEDLGQGQNLIPRIKGERAVIGFCGWADFRSFKERSRYYLKLSFTFGLKRQGLWWRRKALTLLRDSKLIATNFLIRKSYSGNEKTISLDPIVARREYIDNILNSDFTLCVKGDGNFSVRFFEVLSLGRIPILIDTDCPLPLEDMIDYDTCILRIPYQNISHLASITADFYNNLNQEQFTAKQIKIREVFEQYLRLDSFFKFWLKNDRLKKYG